MIKLENEVPSFLSNIFSLLIEIDDIFKDFGFFTLFRVRFLFKNVGFI